MKNRKIVYMKTKTHLFIRDMVNETIKTIDLEEKANIGYTEASSLYNRLRFVQSAKANQKVSKYHKNLSREVLKNFVKFDPSTMIVDQLVNEVTDWSEQDLKLVNTLSKVYGDSFDAGFNFLKQTTSEEEQDKLIPITKLNKNTEAYINEFAGSKAKGINDTTRKKLSEDIKKGLLEGETNKQIAERIRRTMNIASNSRSLTIAATETHNAIETGSYTTARDSLFSEKTWNTVADEAVRGSKPTDKANHIVLNQITISINELFGNGLKHPGDPTGSAAEVIGCRCFLTYSGTVSPNAIQVEPEVIDKVPQAEQISDEAAQQLVEDSKPKIIAKEVFYREISPSELKRIAENKWENFDDEIKDAVEEYSGSLYKPVNDVLRFGDSPLYEEGIEDIIESMSKGMNIASLDQDLQLFRGGNIKLLGVKNANQLEGTIGTQFTDAAFTSTSVSKTVASKFAEEGQQKFIFSIQAPKGTRAIPINGFSDFAKEAEMLLDKGLTYEVTEVSRTTNKLLLNRGITHEVTLKIVK